jgi:hypothetical protein
MLAAALFRCRARLGRAPVPRSSKRPASTGSRVRRAASDRAGEPKLRGAREPAPVASSPAAPLRPSPAATSGWAWLPWSRSGRQSFDRGTSVKSHDRHGFLGPALTLAGLVSVLAIAGACGSGGDEPAAVARTTAASASLVTTAGGSCPGRANPCARAWAIAARRCPRTLRRVPALRGRRFGKPAGIAVHPRELERQLVLFLRLLFRSSRRAVGPRRTAAQPIAQDRPDDARELPPRATFAAGGRMRSLIIRAIKSSARRATAFKQPTVA